MYFQLFGSRIAAIFLALAGLAGISLSAQATTYYVRTDGGTATQCTGTTNAAYPGSGSGKACAFNHPFWVLVPGQGSSLMKAGDTLSIGAGSYMMGYGAPNMAAGNCTSGYTAGCYIQDIPSGISASQPTTITGDCSAPPELWGTGGIDEILDMEGGHDIAIKCLNLTDHSNCIEDYPVSGQGVSACSAKDAWSRVGIRANGVKNLTLVDLNVHGFASTGVWAGGLSGTTTVTRVKVVGNGRSGWDGDLGGSGNSNSSGTLTFTDLTVGWTGCSENYPVDGGYKGCFGQNEGGYGDGFSTAKTGGNYIFIRPQIYKNTQDGIDLLYADGTGSVTVDSGNFADDAGNDLKISGSGTVTNSVFVANCTWFGDNGYPAKGDNCRAGGGLLGAFNGPNQVQTWAYNTMVGNPSGMFVGDSTNAQSSDTYYLYNNIFIAVNKNGQQPFFTWFADGSYPEKVVYAGNLVWNTRSTSCDTTRIICKDPQLTDESMTSFNPYPLVSSPAIGNAASVGTPVAYDNNGNPRPSQGATIGALEYQGGSSGTAGAPSANFTYSASGLAVNFTDTSTDTGGTIGSWAWSFGDGTSSSAQSPSHAYAAAGTYQVGLTVTDKVSGKTSTRTAQVVVAAPQPVGGTPSANFTYSTSGLTASFIDASTDNGGSIGSWAWSFGDGTSSSAQSPSHAYAAAGTYQVGLTVTDKVSGKTSTRTAQVVVAAPQPVGGTPSANFTYSTSGLTASFIDASTDNGGSIGSWAWSFGDGTSSSAQSPSHAYAAAGTYQVGLTVTDKVSGKTSTRTAQVTVTAPQLGGGTPKAGFTYSVSGMTGNFTDRSTDKGGTIDAWSWSFGDGTKSSARNPSHVYRSAGHYTVTQTVRDKASGKTSSISRVVRIAKPRASGKTSSISRAVRFAETRLCFSRACYLERSRW